MDPNLTQPIINATIIQPSGGSNIALLAAAIGAGSAIIASIVSNLTSYYNEKRKAEQELRQKLRGERIELYKKLFRKLYSLEIKREYKFFIAPTLIAYDEGGKPSSRIDYLNDKELLQLDERMCHLRAEIDSIVKEFGCELEMIGDLKIPFLLGELFYLSHTIKFSKKDLSPTDIQDYDEDTPFSIIKGTGPLEFDDEPDVRAIKMANVFNQLKELTRSELVPIEITRSELSTRAETDEFDGLTELKEKKWWQFWKDETGRIVEIKWWQFWK